MKRMLIITDIPEFINNFLLPNIRRMQEEGYIVDVATSKGIEIPYINNRFDIDISKSPYRINNIRALRQLKNILTKHQYDIVDTHTPMGGFLGRIAANKYRKKNTTVIYTAHGFHFHYGAPKKNWLFYYPVEKFLSKKTDKLVVLNSEDYCRAKKKFRMKKLYKIDSVGIDIAKFHALSATTKAQLRAENNLDEKDFVISIIGELNKNKNQESIINIIKEKHDSFPNVKLLLIGDGIYKEKFKKIINANNLGKYIKLLGFRRDINELINISNLIISSSYREGLPVNILEAMAVGTPILVSPSRGNVDLIKSGFNGVVSKGFSSKDFQKEIIKYYNNYYDIELYKRNNMLEIKKYGIENIFNQYKKIYASKRKSK